VRCELLNNYMRLVNILQDVFVVWSISSAAL
jgi:hypothetical protein